MVNFVCAHIQITRVQVKLRLRYISRDPINRIRLRFVMVVPTTGFECRNLYTQFIFQIFVLNKHW